jgi:MFS family permease
VVATLTALQFCFALTWVVYVIYLPALAAQAGIDRAHVPFILLMDQAIFVACDWAAGAHADRAARVLGRVGGRMAAVALASCLAFLALPWLAPAAGPAAFLAITALWSATSSALRAPTLALVSRYAPAPALPRIAAMSLLGVGVATAFAPYLGIALKGIDPRWPFALSSVALATFTLALAFAERRVAPAAGQAQPASGPGEGRVPIPLFLLAALLFAVGFQAHFSVNTAAQYSRFVGASELPGYMPVFWIGFNLAMAPASFMPKRFGSANTMAVGGAVGVVALVACAVAPTLPVLVAAQLVAGAAWGITLWSAFTAALDVGRPGREGRVTGVLYSVLAAAAFIRIGAVVWQFPALPLVPPYAWTAAAILAAVLALRYRSPR